MFLSIHLHTSLHKIGGWIPPILARAKVQLRNRIHTPSQGPGTAGATQQPQFLWPSWAQKNKEKMGDCWSTIVVKSKKSWLNTWELLSPINHSQELGLRNKIWMIKLIETNMWPIEMDIKHKRWRWNGNFSNKHPLVGSRITQIWRSAASAPCRRAPKDPTKSSSNGKRQPNPVVSPTEQRTKKMPIGTDDGISRCYICLLKVHVKNIFEKNISFVLYSGASASVLFSAFPRRNCPSMAWR